MGASSSVIDPAKKFTPQHGTPFYLAIDFECVEFPQAPVFNDGVPEGDDKNKTTRTVVVKLHADEAPFACENFRLLASKSTADGGYLGSVISEIHTSLAITGGLIKADADGEGDGRSASAFDGKFFRDETDGELDHGPFTLSMVSGDPANGGTKKGTFGSMFTFNGSGVEEGSIKASMLDQDEGTFVIGDVVQGFFLFDILDSLMTLKAWKIASAQAGRRGSRRYDNRKPGCPVVFKAAREVPYDPAWDEVGETTAEKVARRGADAVTCNEDEQKRTPGKRGAK